MQKRFYSARRMNVAEKSGQLSGFSSVQPCISQSEQNETDEPPSLLNPLNSGIKLYRHSEIKTRHLRFVNLPPLFFISNIDAPEERKVFFFRGEIEERCFIVRDKRGRIKNIILGKKRST